MKQVAKRPLIADVTLESVSFFSTYLDNNYLLHCYNALFIFFPLGEYVSKYIK